MLRDDFCREWASRLFSGARYEFGFGMRRGRDENWFRWDGWDSQALDERRHWVTETPQTCVVWSPEADSLLMEALQLFPPSAGVVPLDGMVPTRVLHLARVWEPDWLLLKRKPDGEFHLAGAVVCFPSSWDVGEKMGRSVTDVHSVVPTLNASLGERIRSFLARLPDGMVFERENWGLAAFADRNAHPGRGLPRLGPDATLETTWLRLEHQAFRLLPVSGGLLFALHIRVIRLDELLFEAPARLDFARMLRTMPTEIAEYKGLASARAALIEACLGS